MVKTKGIGILPDIFPDTAKRLRCNTQIRRDAAQWYPQGNFGLAANKCLIAFGRVLSKVGVPHRYFVYQGLVCYLFY